MADKTEYHLKIRRARLEDAGALLAIYAPYVRETAISFEYEVPAVEAFRERIAQTLTRYPYIVGERDGRIVGYAYVSAFHARPAYDWSVETSIYVDRGEKGHGYGRQLYGALEALLRQQHVINLYACIAYIEEADDHLTNDSRYFHERLGYRLVGTFRQCGYKFGKWYDMIWMEKMIGEHGAQPEAFLPFSAMGESGGGRFEHPGNGRLCEKSLDKSQGLA